MAIQAVMTGASHHLPSVAVLCFGVATLMIVLYTFLHDYILLAKSH